MHVLLELLPVAAAHQRSRVFSHDQVSRHGVFHLFSRRRPDVLVFVVVARRVAKFATVGTSMMYVHFLTRPLCRSHELDRRRLNNQSALRVCVEAVAERVRCITLETRADDTMRATIRTLE